MVDDRSDSGRRDLYFRGVGRERGRVGSPTCVGGSVWSVYKGKSFVSLSSRIVLSREENEEAIEETHCKSLVLHFHLSSL